MTKEHSHGQDDNAIEEAADGARDAVVEAADHPFVEKGARVGYGANAVMHLVIAFIAVQLAMGRYSGSADQSGALGMLADHAWGVALLVIGVVGWLLLSLWQLGEGLLPWAEPTDRIKAVGKAVVYGALAWTCFGAVRHGGSSGSKQNVDTTQGLLESGWGRAAVVVGALVILGVGGYHVYKGWTKKFREDLRENPGEWAERAGQVGYLAKGVALVVVGVLVAQAALTSQASKAGGLDAAFRTVLQAPFGRVLVVLIGLGFAAYAAYSLARAKHARV